jgi:hypothetical protein
MYALLGHWLPLGFPAEWTIADRIRHGREELVDIAGVDLGYDPAAWHEHLQRTNDGGYRWSNKHLGFPRKIATAMADPEWLYAVDSLKNE